MSSRVRAVLFDIGGPIDMEIEHERLVDRDMRAALAKEGFAVSETEFQAANDAGVAAFAPNLYRAMIWELTGHDRGDSERVAAQLNAGSLARLRERGRYELRPGTGELLSRLKDGGFALGLAANQPEWAPAALDAAGILRFFNHRGASGTLGYRKPDVRLFLQACDALGVEPEETIMVGDRIDNDICPAKTLGLRTILFRTGRHANQQPRSWDEIPDAEAWNVSELEAAIGRLAAEAPAASERP